MCVVYNMWYMYLSVLYVVCVFIVYVCICVWVCMHVGQRTTSGIIPQSPFTFCLRQGLSLTWRDPFCQVG